MATPAPAPAQTSSKLGAWWKAFGFAAAAAALQTAGQVVGSNSGSVDWGQVGIGSAVGALIGALGYLTKSPLQPAAPPASQPPQQP